MQLYRPDAFRYVNWRTYFVQYMDNAGSSRHRFHTPFVLNNKLPARLGYVCHRTVVGGRSAYDQRAFAQDNTPTIT
jgi:hypothetical protein